MLATMIGMVMSVATQGGFFYDGKALHQLWLAYKRNDEPSHADIGDLARAAELRGYVGGIAGALGSGNRLCLPDGVDLPQLVAVAGKWLDNHPEKWNENPAGPIAGAITRAFPCPKT
jgi:hypothetical protein